MTQLITPEYRDLNAKLHKAGNYGGGGWKWVGVALHFFLRQKASRIIDYGCGQGSFGAWWPYDLYPCVDYDPVTFPNRPERADGTFVVCCDVMEHVEPQCLGDVLSDIGLYATAGALFVIATKPAKKVLADGRNAHLIVEQAPFWLHKLGLHFGSVRTVNVGKPGELVVFCEPA